MAQSLCRENGEKRKIEFRYLVGVSQFGQTAVGPKGQFRDLKFEFLYLLSPVGVRFYFAPPFRQSILDNERIQVFR